MRRMLRYGAGVGLLLVTLLAAVPARAQLAAAVRHYDAGNERFRQGDYRGALAAYEQALEAGYASGRLYYNMGNAYYRLDNLGQAIRYYEKARDLTPDDRALLHNLRVARARLVDQFSQVPPPFWAVGWQHVRAAAGLWAYFGVGLAFYLLAAVLLGYRIRTGTRNPWHRRALTVTVLTGGLFLLTAFAASASGPERAVLVTPEAALHETPDDDAPASMAVHEGTVVEVLRARGDWAEVRLPNGVTGWLHAGAVAGI